MHWASMLALSCILLKRVFLLLNLLPLLLLLLLLPLQQVIPSGSSTADLAKQLVQMAQDRDLQGIVVGLPINPHVGVRNWGWGGGAKRHFTRTRAQRSVRLLVRLFAGGAKGVREQGLSGTQALSMYKKCSSLKETLFQVLCAAPTCASPSCCCFLLGLVRAEHSD